MSKLTIHYSTKFLKPIFFMPFVFLICSCSQQNNRKEEPMGYVFSKDNLVAWCIVPFDSEKRGPGERAQMLNDLGITKFAYDWREEHVPTFDAEMEALKKNHIELTGFWMPYGPDPVNSIHYREILDLLKRHHIKTQLWWSYGSNDEALIKMTQAEKVRVVSNMVKPMVEDAAAIGCTVGLYNHNGWFGEPENELAILKKVDMPNVGIVYNFNHAEDQTDRFSQFFPKIIPHLIALNIAGIEKGPPGRIVPVGKGDSEKEMIRIVAESGYIGPLGIINEDTAPDAEVGLKMNMEGLKEILKSLSYPDTLESYRR